MERITQLGYVGLSVSNVDAWERFATEVLGLEANGRDADGTLFLRMDEQHHRFIVHPRGDDDLAYAGWQVANEQALEGLAAQLTQAGVAVAWGNAAETEARRVKGLISFRDPSGIASEIYYGPQMSYDSRFRSPRPISSFVTGSLGLGHIVIGVDDPDESLRFYRDVLGMRVTDFIRHTRPDFEMNLTFLHCNPRHHSLAFMRARGAKRLSHFMLQLASLDDVGTTYSLCQEQGTPITTELGRHSNDHMLSFYMRSPSGFSVEYGWGAREIDDSTWQVQSHVVGSIWGHRHVAEQQAAPAPALAR